MTNPEQPRTRRPARNLPPTTKRRYIDAASHMPPAAMVDNAGNPWRGTARIDKPARRRTSRRTWLRVLADGRRATMAAKA